MKKPVTKSQIRQEIESQIDEFLQKGGDVNYVPRGVSSRNPGDPPLKPSRDLFSQPRESRTYVPEIVAAVEQRRKTGQSKKPHRSADAANRPRKKLLYDDFGEPLKWEWTNN